MSKHTEGPSPSRLVRVLAAAVAASLVGAGGATASASTAIFFETPSKNIVCVYISATGQQALLQCGVGSGLHPPAPKPVPACTVTDPAGNRVELDSTGKTHGFCSGDVGVLAELGRAPVLAYGTTWRRGSFVCRSMISGLECRNGSGHGFFLSRQSWHAF
jgi:hypothetical protein